MRTDEIKNEIYEIKKWREKIKRKDLKYETGKYKYDFQKYQTIRSFSESIYAGKISIHQAEMDQTNLLEKLVNFNSKFRPKTKESKDKKQNSVSISDLHKGRELTLNALRSEIFLIKEIQGKTLKILIPKQKLQRLPIALAQVKAGNTSENVLNEIRQIIYSLYRAKEITKEVYNNILNSIKLQNRMDTIFMNCKNSKTSDPHRLLLNLTDKINLNSSDKYVALSNLTIYYSWKI